MWGTVTHATRLELEGVLACPDCGAVLPGLDQWKRDGAVCPNCGDAFPIIRGVPRFVTMDNYAGSFGFEWNRHRRTQLDDGTSRESEETFRTKTGLSPTEVAGRLVLDVGCGMGRFADVVSRWGGQVVGVDLSAAVEAARANLEDRPNVQILQADCFRLPFARDSFDVIYSLGVLHHTPDCAAAFRALVPFLKPGGTLAIWVYAHMGPWVHFANLYRCLTTRMPHRLLYALCHLAVPLYHLHRVPRVGTLTQTLLPTSMHPKASWRVLDTFDWYSPRYQSMHDPEEVRGWLEAAGLIDIRVLATPVSVRGRRPVPAEAARG